MAQTTWTENAAAYNLDLNGNKDGGFSFCDFDLDGDFDLLINTNSSSYLYENIGGTTFNDITASRAPELTNSARERCAVWGDLNNDGYPDFARNTSNRGIEVFLQDPVTGNFGDGNGGFATQEYNGNNPGNFNIADGVNTEGMGFIDYNGDGYLDIVFDNHNFGVDMLENDGSGFFTHATAKGPSYNAGNPATWPLGLAQDAVDGDYGSVTDYDNDGWVDFIARKRNQVDFFRNIGGTFDEAVDLDQSKNGNKGAVNFSDFDNDGDFDLYWTENGTNQIYENQNGNFVALGAATGIPTGFGGNRIDGLACGDVDNDGDIDIFLAGDQTGFLYINQINDPIGGANTGAAMTFVDSGETFYNDDGEGASFVDIDNDGDLDLYVNIRNDENVLFINNLSGPALDNYLFVDIKENRAIANMPAGVERDALGATLCLVDCDGNVISGIREINGGNGHGTQDVSRIHFGLPDGPADYYILQASYPNIAGQPRLQINEEIRPVDYAYHLYEITYDAALNNAPIGQDDILYFTENTPLTFNPLLDHGNGVDSDPDGDAIYVYAIGTPPSNGTASVNGNGTITYTPGTDFIGIDTFTYIIADNPFCAAAGLFDEITVELIYQDSPDNCVVSFDPYTWTELPPNDDGSTPQINIPFDFLLYGITYNSLYINNNGNVSFDNPYAWFTSAGFPIGTPMIAPFWGDVDTRDWGPYGYQGEVWYTVNSNSVYVTWLNVGPYNAYAAVNDNLQNTFTLVMSDGTDPILAPGNNIGFFYGDMQWTTGSASGGTDGFGGSPATVGVNAGNGVDYVLLGMYNQDNPDYDGPGGNDDGVNWLDDECFEWNVSSSENFPPVAQGFPQGNSYNICFGATETLNLGFTGPETDEIVDLTINTNAWAGATILSSANGNPATAALEITGDVVGTYIISLTATDNDVETETTTIDLIVNVLDCNCSAPPSIACAADQTSNTDLNSCDANLSVTAPAVVSSCFGTTAIDFDGTNDFIQVPNRINDGAFAIDFWFKPEASTWNGTIFDMSEDDDANGTNQRYFYIHGDQNGLEFSFESDDDSDVNLNANLDLSEVRWYHVVVNGNFNAAGPHQMYIDGSLEASSNATTSAKPTTYRTPRIGNYGSSYVVPQNAFGGQIDNFRIYNTNLSATEVSEVACSNLTSVPNNLIMNLQFEDGTGSATASDSGPDGNDGTLNNMNVANVWVSSDLISECTTLTNNITGTNDASGVYPLGSTNVIWTATNTSGNSNSCTQVITVLDNQAPSITCPANINTSNAPGLCEANIALGNPVVSDNCGVPTFSNNAPATFPIGTTDVIWTVTDGAGNTSTCTQTVSVNDNELPNAVCQDLTVELDASGSASISSAMIDNGASDNCGIDNISISQNSFDCSDLSSGTTITSSNGYNVNINVDAININPSSFSCAFGYNYTVDLAYTVTFDGANIPSNLFTLQGTIGCGLNSHFFNLPNTGGSGTVTSANSYTSNTDCATVTPESLGCNTINIQISGPGIPNQTITLNPSAVPVTMTVTDTNGNVNTCTSMVTVEDNIPPTITCAANVNASTDLGSCFATVSLAAPSTADNCGVASVTNNAPATFPIGTTPVTWTVTDNAGNTATCSQNATVADNENPTITCGGDISVNTNAAGCRANVTVPAPTTSDNCGISSLVNNYNGTTNASDNYPVGTTTVVWTITDNAGNSSTCSQDITVIDNLTADAGSNLTVCEGETVNLFANASGASPFLYSWNNGLGNTPTPSFVGSLGTYANQTTTYTVTVSDDNGCIDTDNVNVTILSVPQASISTVDATCGSNNGSVTFSFNGHPNRGAVEYSLNGGSSYQPAVADNSGAVTYNGLAPGTYTFFARWGNDECPVSLGSFTISDVDTTDPTIVCPANITASTSAAFCSANVSVAVPVTNDNCSVTSLVNDFNATGNASGVYPLGTTAVLWTVSDYNGNTASCSMNITVIDDVAPVITCASDVIASTNLGSCSASIALPSPVATDNCGLASLIDNAPATFPIGTTTVTYTAVDNAGNVSTCAIDVIVSDNENPTITCAADVNTTTDAGSCFAAVVLAAPTTSDNCGVASVNNDAPATFPIGTTTVTWTVTDNAGNTATCTQDVMVTDNENPTITCAADVNATTDAGSCFATVVLAAPTTADNCGVASVSNNAPATFPIGTTTVTWTVTDNAGNTATCIQDVTVTDIENPTIICAADVNATTDAGSCFATVVLAAATTADNCGVASVNNNAPATFPIGTTTVTWTVTDNAGNTATCTQDVTVTDNENPTITCAAAVNTTTDADDCFATVVLAAPTTADNCGVTSV
ncbi:MAG: HYR domain-containing protein, partial [Flavobacteriales bacterium]|nr:HYR domain-containing protein [Flavobacteriales bacterium]